MAMAEPHGNLDRDLREPRGVPGMSDSVSPMESPTNLVAHLRRLAMDACVRYGADGRDSRERAMSSPMLSWTGALALWPRRCRKHSEPGDRALLLLGNDEHYVTAFLGCLYAGLIAVPAFPPESMRESHLGRLRGIASDAQARCVLMERSRIRASPERVPVHGRDAADHRR